MVDSNRYNQLINLHFLKPASFLVVFFLLIAPSFVAGGTLSIFADRAVAKKTDNANKAYDEGQFDEALKGYSDVQLTRPESSEIQHNIGNVHYRKGNFEEAKKAYEAALSGDDSTKKAAAWYNIGNTLFREGASGGEMEKLEESIEAFKKCLKENPDDVDAKYNIEYIRRKLKENAKKEQKQDQKQDKQDEKKQDQQNQDQQKQDQQNQDQKQEQKQDPDKQDQQNKEDEKNKKSEEDQKKQEEQKKKASDKADEQKQQQEKRTKIDPEQAKRWLDRLKEQEKENMKKEMTRDNGQRRGNSHDW